MIKAEEAWRKTTLNKELKSVMERIEKRINEAIADGKYIASVMFGNNLKPVFVDALIKELESLGYTAEYEPADPLPSGCPVDQWSFNSYLRVSWQQEEE